MPVGSPASGPTPTSTGTCGRPSSRPASSCSARAFAASACGRRPSWRGSATRRPTGTFATRTSWWRRSPRRGSGSSPLTCGRARHRCRRGPDGLRAIGWGYNLIRACASSFRTIFGGVVPADRGRFTPPCRRPARRPSGASRADPGGRARRLAAPRDRGDVTGRLVARPPASYAPARREARHTNRTPPQRRRSSTTSTTAGRLSLAL